jgi:hypothetical protein
MDLEIDHKSRLKIAKLRNIFSVKQNGYYKKIYLNFLK